MKHAFLLHMKERRMSSKHHSSLHVKKALNASSIYFIRSWALLLFPNSHQKSPSIWIVQMHLSLDNAVFDSDVQVFASVLLKSLQPCTKQLFEMQWSDTSDDMHHIPVSIKYAYGIVIPIMTIAHNAAAIVVLPTWATASVCQRVPAKRSHICDILY